MAKKASKAFKDIVSQDENGHITVDLSQINGVVDVIEPINGSVQLKPPAPEQDNTAQNTITAGPTVESFDPSKLEIGQTVAGKGVYVGIHKAEDANGLTQIWDLYAAPEDLTDANDKKLLATYNDSVDALNKKKNWHGHDGECFVNERAMNKAFAGGAYDGGWFIPSWETLFNDLSKNKNEGDFKNTFMHYSGFAYAHCYWSSTEHTYISTHIYDVNFADGDFYWEHKNANKLSTRPVRAELRL